MNARVTNMGDVECPKCKCSIITPIAWNPYNGKEEKMILFPNKPGACPFCKTVFTVDEEQAVKHNKHWFSNEETTS